MISFHVTPAEKALISALAERARDYDFETNGVQARSQMDWEMDITACHANGCQLDLAKLNHADRFNFSHDVFGIARHLNRDNGALMHCFVPRCSR